MRFLSFPQLKSEKGVPYTRRHLRDLVRAGKFPRPVELSEARIAWIEDEIDQWQADKVSLRDPPPSEPEPGSGSAPVIPIGRKQRSLHRGSPADRECADTRPPHS
jgi:predicted DNA-binding transcriptional regulator AlpA